MKRFRKIFVVVIAVALCAHGAFAQDALTPLRRAFPTESPTPSPSPKRRATPKPTATPQPTPQPTARPTPTPPPPPPPPPTATATPAETPQPSATPAATAEPERRGGARAFPRITPSGLTSPRERRETRREERERPERRPFFRRAPAQPNPSGRRYRPTFDLSDSGWRTRSAIRALESKWQDAIKAHDADALDQLLADDFTATSVDGNEAGRARIIRGVRNDKHTYRSARVQKLQVRLVRRGTAVVTGIATESGTKENGEPFMSSMRFTDTWKLRDGEWRCVSSVAKRLPES